MGSPAVKLLLQRLTAAIAHYDYYNHTLVRSMGFSGVPYDVQGFGVFHTQAVSRLIQRHQRQKTLELIAVTEPGLFRVTWLMCRASVHEMSISNPVKAQGTLQVIILVTLPMITILLGFFGKPAVDPPAVLLASPFVVWFVTMQTLRLLFQFDIALVPLLALTLVTSERFTPSTAVVLHVSVVAVMFMVVTLFHAVGWARINPVVLVPASLAGLVMLALLSELTVRGWWRWLARNGAFHPDDMRSITQAG